MKSADSRFEYPGVVCQDPERRRRTVD